MYKIVFLFWIVSLWMTFMMYLLLIFRVLMFIIDYVEVLVLIHFLFFCFLDIPDY